MDRRIVLMQFTLIFCGWLVIALNNPMLALVLLIMLKVIATLTGVNAGQEQNPANNRCLTGKKEKPTQRNIAVQWENAL